MIIIKKEHELQIKRVAKAASTKASIQAYENILIDATGEKVVLTAGDGSVEITAIVGAEIETKGITSVNASKLIAAINACKWDAKLSFSDGAVKITGKGRRFTLATLDHEHYPKMPEENTDILITDQSDLLISDIKAANLIAPIGDVRYFLNGVRVGDGVTATDGHRLLVIDGGYNGGVIIPKTSINAIPDSVEGVVKCNQNIISFIGTDIIVKSKLLDGKYPDIKRAIQTPSVIMTVDAAELAEAVKSAQVTANTETNAIRLYAGKDCAIESTGAKRDNSRVEFYASVEGEYEGGFNAKYLIDALSYYDGDIQIGFSDGNQAIIIHNGITNVVMGVRL